MMNAKKNILVVLVCLGIALLFFALPVQAYTTEVHVVKYAPDGTTILNETTVNYTWMEGNLPVWGDGVTHHYFQGPVFEDEWNDAHPGELWDIWNPTEDVNLDSRDYGAVKGTNVADLCDLVGGMSYGDKVKIMAPDGFSKWFPWDDIYNYNSQPKQGPMVLCWYNGEESITGEHQGVGYPGPSNYSTGMRLVFFADTSTNTGGKHVFGNWDMHESLPEKCYHFYELYPSTNGFSVKWIDEIRIYTGGYTGEHGGPAKSMPTPTPQSIPGFELVSALAGLVLVTYAVRRQDR